MYFMFPYLTFIIDKNITQVQEFINLLKVSFFLESEFCCHACFRNIVIYLVEN